MPAPTSTNKNPKSQQKNHPESKPRILDRTEALNKNTPARARTGITSTSTSTSNIGHRQPENISSSGSSSSAAATASTVFPQQQPLYRPQIRSQSRVHQYQRQPDLGSGGPGIRDIRKTKEYKVLARKWTSTIVALPILMYTSYILYERVYGSQRPKRLGSGPVERGRVDIDRDQSQSG